MTLRELIRSSYQERVALAPVPEELKRALKTHERIPKFFDNLERELAALHPKLRTNIHIKDCVYSMTDIFLGAVKKRADEKQLSDLAKQAEIEAKAKAARTNELADRMNRGEAIDLSEVL